MDTPQIALTEHQQWAVTIALEIEIMGWVGAASALRRKHFPELPWDKVEKAHGAATHQGWINLFRIHHGSLPPFAPAPGRRPIPDTFPLLPPKPSIHHGPPPAPRPMVPAPRADQIIS